MAGIRDRLRAGAPGQRLSAGARAAAATSPARAARSAWHAASPVGRTVAVIAAGTWLLGLRLGWQELFLVSACCVIALVLAVGFVAGSPSLDVTIELDPVRVTVGAPAAGRLVAVNQSRTRLRPISIEVPVGASRAVFDLPSLARGESADELFVVPTSRRAVITIGPASAVRTDPLGLLRREAVEQAAVELFVHPRIVGIDGLGLGVQRDLEGQTTSDLSTSDLAFHTLRDYVSGDDRRYVHWRSSAKAGKLLVRQFQDTRRSRLTIVVDGASTPVDQVRKQLEKLVRVLKVVELPEQAAVERELALIKVTVRPDLRADLLDVAATFSATVVDLSADTLVLEAVCSPGKLDSLLTTLERHGTCELVRTGLIAIGRGSETITDDMPGREPAVAAAG